MNDKLPTRNHEKRLLEIQTIFRMLPMNFHNSILPSRMVLENIKLRLEMVREIGHNKSCLSLQAILRVLYERLSHWNNIKRLFQTVLAAIEEGNEAEIQNIFTFLEKNGIPFRSSLFMTALSEPIELNSEGPYDGVTRVLTKSLVLFTTSLIVASENEVYSRVGVNAKQLQGELQCCFPGSDTNSFSILMTNIEKGGSVWIVNPDGRVHEFERISSLISPSRAWRAQIKIMETFLKRNFGVKHIDFSGVMLPSRDFERVFRPLEQMQQLYTLFLHEDYHHHFLS